MKGAFYTGEYRNVFAENGYLEDEIEDRVKMVFETLFYGSDSERIYHSVGTDLGYIVDTGNNDVRTEGMSYGMMMCVQMDKKEEFDRIWNWSMTYMYMPEEDPKSGENAGYFAWSCQTDGTKNSWGPAPDGEEYYAMALFFASHRWGDGEGIYAYSHWAQQILKDCIHKGEKEGSGHPMWEPSNKLIKFIPDCDFSDPSYHLPHFYELFALWAAAEDRAFWKEAAANSRAYLKKACHPVTGLCAEYADYEGRPFAGFDAQYRHDWYYSDAYRTIANIGLDYLWFAADEWETEAANRLQHFFGETESGCTNGVYLIDGTKVEEVQALHPVAIIATNAQASLAASESYASEWVRRFWDTALREGDRRYYDNCLYLFAMLALSGKYRIFGVL